MSGCFCMGPQNGQPFCPCKMEQMNKWITALEGTNITKISHPSILSEEFQIINAAINEVNSRKNK